MKALNWLKLITGIVLIEAGLFFIEPFTFKNWFIVHSIAGGFIIIGWAWISLALINEVG